MYNFHFKRNKDSFAFTNPVVPTQPLKMANTKIGKLSLVGAGPGDPDLITLKGVKTLNAADVVLYDALANPALLEHAPTNAEKIFVGKRAGHHRLSQDEINLLIVQKALQGNHVVRLKGGDSFVFGRGHEEMEFARNFEIETTIVPGISSSISVPALQEIPLTRRGISESFWVMTATTKEGKFSQDIAIAAQSTATVVVLMGMRKLPQIVDAFLAQNKADLPVMIVQNGSRPNEQKVLGTIDSIEEKVANSGISTPAIIVIGEVVKLHRELRAVYELATV